MPIPFRIQHLETLQFALLKENINEEKMAFSVSFEFGIDPDAKMIRTIFRYQLLEDTATALLIEVAVHTAIKEDEFDEKLKSKEGLFIPKDFAVHLGVIAVGTTRGILHEKTKDSVLNKYPIQTINVVELINSDITFPINAEEAVSA